MTSQFDLNWEFIELLIGKDPASIVQMYARRNPPSYLYDVIHRRWKLQKVNLAPFQFSLSSTRRDPKFWIRLPIGINTEMLMLFRKMKIGGKKLKASMCTRQYWLNRYLQHGHSHWNWMLFRDQMNVENYIFISNKETQRILGKTIDSGTSSFHQDHLGVISLV
jgi:hypothetical protein